MSKTLPTEAAAFPESPRLTRRHLLTSLAVATAAFTPLAAQAQKPTASIRSLKSVRSLAGTGSDVLVQVVSNAPFYAGANGWVLTLGKRQYGDYTYGPKGETNILQFRVPSADFSRMASGEPASLRYGDTARPGISLGRLNRSLLSR